MNDFIFLQRRREEDESIIITESDDALSRNLSQYTKCLLDERKRETEKLINTC